MTRPYLKPQDLAEQWGVSVRKVNSLISDGLVRAFRIGRHIRIRAADAPEVMPQKPRVSRRRPISLPDSGVYMLFRDGELIYIGRSSELPRRITNHRRAGREFDEVRAIPCDYATAEWLEAELIRTLQPPENIKRFIRRAQRIEAALADALQ